MSKDFKCKCKIWESRAAIYEKHLLKLKYLIAENDEHLSSNFVLNIVNSAFKKMGEYEDFLIKRVFNVVDTSNCEFYLDEECQINSYLCNCEINKDCYYKQLQTLQARAERYEKFLIWLEKELSGYGNNATVNPHRYREYVKQALQGD